MATYRVTCQGSRGEASRLGGKDSGVQAHLSSWKHHVYVSMNEIDGKDDLGITITDRSGKTIKEYHPKLN